jgi:hypothetical protein
MGLALEVVGPTLGLDHGLQGSNLRSPLTESNRRPSPYHGDALPTELRGPGQALALPDRLGIRAREESPPAPHHRASRAYTRSTPSASRAPALTEPPARLESGSRPERRQDPGPHLRQGIYHLKVPAPLQHIAPRIVPRGHRTSRVRAAHLHRHPVIPSPVHQPQQGPRRHQPHRVRRRISRPQGRRSPAHQVPSGIVIQPEPVARGEITHPGQADHPHPRRPASMPRVPARQPDPPGRPQSQVTPSGVPGHHDAPGIDRRTDGLAHEAGQCIDSESDVVKGPRPPATRLPSPPVLGDTDNKARRGQRIAQRPGVGPVDGPAPEPAVQENKQRRPAASGKTASPGLASSRQAQVSDLVLARAI